jgi:hypothetical protein
MRADTEAEDGMGSGTPQLCRRISYGEQGPKRATACSPRPATTTTRRGGGRIPYVGDAVEQQSRVERPAEPAEGPVAGGEAAVGQSPQHRQERSLHAEVEDGWRVFWITRGSRAEQLHAEQTQSVVLDVQRQMPATGPPGAP